MPWQQRVADVAMEIDPDTGYLWYREVDLLVPRQSGKTTELLALMVDRAINFQRAQRIVYAAQTRNDARKKWEDDHLPILGASPFRRRYRVRKTNGNEAVLWKGGSIQTLASSTEKAGHGPTLDLPVIDEAFAQPDNRLEQAFKPTMVTRKGAQLWVCSTAGKSPGKSPYLWRKVEAGRQRCDAGAESRIAYFEWSAGDDQDRADPATWWGCMPALGLTVLLEAVESDFDSMDPAEFDRAYLNRWNPHEVDAVIPPGDWARGLDETSVILDPLSIAFDVTPDRAWSAIASAGDRRTAKGDRLYRAPGTHVEIVDHRPGTGWVVDRIVDLVRTHSPKIVVCDPAGPAGGLLAALAERGVEVQLATTRDHQQACGALFDDIVERRLFHRPDPRLDNAVAGASKRSIGDAWLWSRTSSSVDISPLVATTLARWGHHRLPDADPEATEDIVITS